MALQGVLLAAGLAGSHLVTSAIEHPADLGLLPAVGAIGRDGHRIARQQRGAGRSGRSGGGPAPGRRGWCRSWRPTTSPARSSRSPSWRQLPVAGACSSTATRCRPPARRRWTCATLPIDLLSLSGHKLHGPKGVGALYVREGVELWPLLPGGGQERGRRSGTENVAGHRGTWAAPPNWPPPNDPRKPPGWSRIRDHLIEGILAKIDNAYLIGHRWRRLPGHICLGFDGMEGEAIKLLLELDERGHCHFLGQRVQRNPRRPAFPRVGGPGVRSAQGPRLAEDFAGAVQYQGRGRPVPGSAAPGRGFAAADPQTDESGITPYGVGREE